MKQWFSALSMVLGGVALFGAACSGSNGSKASSDAGSNDDSVRDAGSSAADGGDASEDSATPPPQAFLRVAHVSPDMPPIDVCVALHGTTTFQGPLVGQLAGTLSPDDAGTGGAPGLAYTQVSAYLPLAPGQYDVRIVSAGSSSCDPVVPLARPFVSDGGDDSGLPDAATDDSGALDAGAKDASVDATTDAGLVVDAGDDATAPPGVPDATNLPSLSFNTYTTLLVAGELTPASSDRGVTLAMLPDDAVLPGGAAVLRAVNAVPSSPALDFGLESSATEWLPLLTDVAFAAASTQAASGAGAIDSNGYLPIAPLLGQALSARASSDAAADSAVAASVEIDLGAIATVVAIGGKTGDSAHPPALLLCIDNQPSGGLLSDCSVAASSAADGGQP